MRIKNAAEKVMMVWTYRQIAAALDLDAEAVREDMAEYIPNNDIDSAIWIQEEDGVVSVAVSTEDAIAFMKKSLSEFVTEENMENIVGFMRRYDEESTEEPSYDI